MERDAADSIGQLLRVLRASGLSLIHPTAWAAVEAFVAREPLSWRIDARSELSDLLRTSSTEERLKSDVDALFLSYYPPADGMTYRDWLHKVEQYLRDHEH